MGFNNLTTIGFSLVISQTLEDDLPDFSKLVSIGRGLTISNNSELLELPNFDNLTSINNRLVWR